MKKLDIQARLHCASSAVSVLKALQIRSETMTYGQFADAIGLLAGDGKWRPWHRQQVSDILYLVSAAEKQGGKKVGTSLNFEVIVDQKGQHGVGLKKISKIIKT